jgi:hypothetical protein
MRGSTAWKKQSMCCVGTTGKVARKKKPSAPTIERHPQSLAMPLSLFSEQCALKPAYHAWWDCRRQAFRPARTATRGPAHQQTMRRCTKVPFYPCAC